MQESFWRWQCSDRYIISLSPNLHTPFSPSIISLMVSVDLKHYVYLLTKFMTNERSKSPYTNTIHCIVTSPPPPKKKKHCCKHTFYKTTHQTSPCVDTVGVTQGPHHPTLPAGRQITSLFVQRFESRGPATGGANKLVRNNRAAATQPWNERLQLQDLERGWPQIPLCADNFRVHKALSSQYNDLFLFGVKLSLHNVTTYFYLAPRNPLSCLT